MKKALFITLASVLCLVAFAQPEKELIERTYLLSQTVFGTKDSATLENLFAKKLSYGHSSGKAENRQEALTAISGNRSTYSDTAVSNVTVVIDGKSAVVRHLFKAMERKPDGTTSPLNFTMMLVWVKQKGAWRLMGRQAAKLI